MVGKVTSLLIHLCVFGPLCPSCWWMAWVCSRMVLLPKKTKRLAPGLKPPLSVCGVTRSLILLSATELAVMRPWPLLLSLRDFLPLVSWMPWIILNALFACSLRLAPACWRIPAFLGVCAVCLLWTCHRRWVSWGGHLCEHAAALLAGIELTVWNSCPTLPRHQARTISCTNWLWPWLGKGDKIKTHPCPPQRCTVLDGLLPQNLPASCLARWQFPTRTPLGLCSRWLCCSPLCCSSNCVWMGTHSTRRQHATWELHRRIWFAFLNTLLRCMAPTSCTHHAGRLYQRASPQQPFTIQTATHARPLANTTAEREAYRPASDQATPPAPRKPPNRASFELFPPRTNLRGAQRRYHWRTTTRRGHR